MATKTQVTVTVTDDMDGTEGAETIPFSIEGTHYEVDLGPKNTEAFRKAVAPFVDAARRVRNPGKTKMAAPKPQGLASQNGYRLQDIRDWAKTQGMEVSDRGRIATAIVEQYHENQQNGGRRRPPAAKKTPAKKVTAAGKS